MDPRSADLSQLIFRAHLHRAQSTLQALSIALREDAGDTALYEAFAAREAIESVFIAVSALREPSTVVEALLLLRDYGHLVVGWYLAYAVDPPIGHVVCGDVTRQAATVALTAALWKLSDVLDGFDARAPGAGTVMPPSPRS